MKADAAKFEAEAKAPSSFVEIRKSSDTPSDDGFAKVEAKLKALEEKMKADAAKFEAEAKAPPSSFLEWGGSSSLSQTMHGQSVEQEVLAMQQGCMTNKCAKQFSECESDSNC